MSTQTVLFVICRKQRALLVADGINRIRETSKLACNVGAGVVGTIDGAAAEVVETQWSPRFGTRSRPYLHLRGAFPFGHLQFKVGGLSVGKVVCRQGPPKPGRASIAAHNRLMMTSSQIV